MKMRAVHRGLPDGMFDYQVFREKSRGLFPEKAKENIPE